MRTAFERIDDPSNLVAEHPEILGPDPGRFKSEIGLKSRIISDNQLLFKALQIMER
jgi:hypothetical protein